jgi:GNAT superfamily N-acetyltransferase
MKIRAAAPADAKEIARIHVDTWRAAYRGIVPEDYLANLSYAESQEMWRRVAGEDGEQAGCLFVAEEGGTLFGFASGSPRRRFSQGFAVYRGELQALYVLPSRQRAGAGRQLVGAVACCLAECGVSSMLLWVLKENRIARRFYESLGGVPVGEDSFELGGVELSEVAYGWKDLNVLRTVTGSNSP